MFRRALYVTAVAAALLAAAPAIAADQVDTNHLPCSCCSDGSMHQTDHPIHRTDRVIRGHTASKDASRAAPPRQSDDPYVRNQSFGG